MALISIAQRMGERVTGESYPKKFDGEYDFDFDGDGLYWDRKKWKQEVWNAFRADPPGSLRAILGVSIPDDVQHELEMFERADPDFQPDFQRGVEVQPVKPNDDYSGDIR
ncbi:MAG: hypothetical protein U5L95_01370 [Candidatus Saccharibacteria bacterium]|nr:hypothetical protein [Candidatus Saccharibacteria bacterium]